MVSHHLARYRPLAAAAAGLLLVAGCGSSSSSSASGGSDGSTPKAKAVSLTRANYASVLSKATTKARSVHLDLTTSMQGVTVHVVGDTKLDPTGKNPEVRMTAGTGAHKLDFRLVDRTLYVDTGASTKDKFVKISLDDSSNPMAKQFSSFLDQADPGKQLASYQKAVTSLTKSGSPKTIDGVKAQPYAMTIDTTKLPKLFGASSPSGSAVPKTITETIWVGSDGLPRLITADIAGQKSRTALSHWGEDVTISAPPASRVTTEKGLSTVKS